MSPSVVALVRRRVRLLDSEHDDPNNISFCVGISNSATEFKPRTSLQGGAAAAAGECTLVLAQATSPALSKIPLDRLLEAVSQREDGVDAAAALSVLDAVTAPNAPPQLRVLLLLSRLFFFGRRPHSTRAHPRDAPRVAV